MSTSDTSQPLVNKVAQSGIITIDLAKYIPSHIATFDIAPHLYQGLILREKDFRAALLTFDWTCYAQQYVHIFCSAEDTIIPTWAYMLSAIYLRPYAAGIVFADQEKAREMFGLEAIAQLSADAYAGQRVVIKGCGEIPVPDALYVAITAKLQPVVKSLMYGEPCSTVPLYKKKA